jgi:hypothetical protein
LPELIFDDYDEGVRKTCVKQIEYEEEKTVFELEANENTNSETEEISTRVQKSWRSSYVHGNECFYWHDIMIYRDI